ncbi:CLUMA_CG012763, isoform A [Clunio marinus]|uniref:CLUMA_CG012763, isoform A n=1 Tax=Clunio marinus TaxID=568069 RepID=A0A1J1IIG9_9DIPT|nr:CLUMA_CG012763, isoform A [Clunio marinus]
MRDSLVRMQISSVVVVIVIHRVWHHSRTIRGKNVLKEKKEKLELQVKELKKKSREKEKKQSSKELLTCSRLKGSYGKQALRMK